MANLSIIVPCYNVEKYIGRCLKSLINQTYNSLKILVIDDGSTDGTKNLVKAFQLKYPDKIYYYYKENEGIAEARNYGLSLVDTAYFGFLDSDDYAREDMYEKMMNKAQETDAEIVVSGFEWVYENHKKKNNKASEGPYQPGKEMMLGLFAVLWNKIYKTKFILDTQLSFPTGYRYEDASFLYRMIPHVKKVSFVEEPFVSYVQRVGSITHTHNEKVKDMVYVFQDILDYFKKNDWYLSYKDELEYIFIRFFLGNSFLRTIQIKEKEDRLLTLSLSWDILESNFPYWKNNQYLRRKGIKNIYYRLINRNNYNVFARLFSLIK